MDLLKEKFSYIDGDIISYDNPEVSGVTASTFENGEKTIETYNISINNILTSKEKIYDINIQYFTINTKDPDRLGVDCINIFPCYSFGKSITDEKGFAIYNTTR